MAYNGWANYETWNVATWLGNEERSQRYWKGAAEDAFREARPERSFTRRERAMIDLSKKLKAEIEASATDLAASKSANMLAAALSEVDWREIAYHYIDEVIEEIGEEPEPDEEASLP